MAIKRFISTKDNTISNLFLPNLSDRGTAGNTGQSDILELFSIHAQASTSSLEKSRILIEFPVSEIQSARTAGDIPAAGSVNFIFNLYNTPHGQTTPDKIDVDINPILIPWEEGFGLDMETYSDKGKSNWLSASSTTAWISSGGDVPNYANFAGDPDAAVSSLTSSIQDISIDVTGMVEEWLKTATAANVRLNFSDIPTNNTKVKLVSTDGTEREYKFLDGGFPNDLNTGKKSASDGTILVDRNGAGTTLNLAGLLARFKEAIEAQVAHGTRLSVVDAPNFIITQAKTGKYGNTLVSVTTPNGEPARISVVKASDGISAATHFEGGNGAENNGFLVKLSGSFEDGTLNRSFYTKKFFARGSQYFFKRPSLEARWDSSKSDDHGKLVTSSPALTSAQNTQTMYYYNYLNGQLSDLPTNPSFSLTTDKDLAQKVTIRSDSNHNTVQDPLNVDFTENAFVDFKINNTSLSDDQGFYQSLIKITHTDSSTSAQTDYYFIGRPPTWTVATSGAHASRVYGIDSTNTAQNRAAAASSLVADMNSTPGFSDVFVAAISPIPSLNGEAVRVYSREAGQAGRSGKITVFRFSNTVNSFLSLINPSNGQPNFNTDNNDAALGIDTQVTRTAAEWETFANSVNSNHFASGYVPVSAVKTNLDNNPGVTSVARSRTFARESGGIAEDILTTKVSTGVYKAEFKIASNIASNTLYQKWWITQAPGGAPNSLNETTGLLKGHAGSHPVPVKQYYQASTASSQEYVTKIVNLKQSYSTSETARLQVFVRNKAEDKNFYTKVVQQPQASYLEDAYYEIRRLADNLIVVPYSTGSIKYSKLSYDKDGNYFNLDMSLLEPNYAYQISFLKKDGAGYIELKDKFKFRVD